jgi:hypothetical protein
VLSWGDDPCVRDWLIGIDTPVSPAIGACFDTFFHSLRMTFYLMQPEKGGLPDAQNSGKITIAEASKRLQAAGQALAECIAKAKGCPCEKPCGK